MKAQRARHYDTKEETPPKLRGLDDDPKFSKGSKDRLQRAMRDLITTRIGPEFALLISDKIRESDHAFKGEL
jgi:hypothetical protein